MERDTGFLTKILISNILIIIGPLLVILTVCSIFIGMVKAPLRKNPYLFQLLRFVIYTLGLLAYGAIFPLIINLIPTSY